jgi:O-antigen ligase
MLLSQTKQDFFRKISPYLINLSLFALLISTSVREISIALFVICWILSGQFKNLKTIFKDYPIAIIACALFILFGIGTIYSPASIEHRLDMLGTYRNLLYVPIILSIYHQTHSDWENGIKSTMVGVLVALVVSILLFSDFLPGSFDKSGSNTIISPTPYSGLLAILIYFLFLKIWFNKNRWFIYLPIALIAFYNLFYQIRSATGIIIFFSLMLLLLWQICSLKKITVGFIIVFAVFVGIYKSSDQMSKEVDEIYTTVTQYKIGSGTMHNNVSLRLDWWYSSSLLIKEKPLFGHGTGSFATVHDKLVEGTNITKFHSPHNDYFLIWVQTGIIGIIIFILLLVIPWWKSFSLEKNARYCLQAIVVFFALGNLFEGWLSGHLISFFYLICTAMILTTTKRRSIS